MPKYIATIEDMPDDRGVGILTGYAQVRAQIIIEAEDEYELANLVRDINDEMAAEGCLTEVPRPVPYEE